MPLAGGDNFDDEVRGSEIVKSFGGRDKYLEAVQKLETALYATSA